MNRAPVLVIVLASVLAVGLIGFFTLFERQEITVPAEAKGEAKYNRFFALERTLAKLDIPVSSVATLSPSRVPLGENDTLVLGDGLERIGVDDAQRIADWVNAGGHLVLAPGPADDAAHTPLLEALGGLSSKRMEEGCDRLSTDGPDKSEASFVLCGPRFLLDDEAAENADLLIGDHQRGYSFARYYAGDGEVSLLSDLAPLSNRELGHAAQQRFALRVLAPSEERHVWLLYALDGPSFWLALFTRGWPGLLALTVLLLAWMAMRSARLGPLMPAPPLQRRALLEHVQAAGEFLYRRDAGLGLHALACRAALARARRQDPSCVELEGEALYERLADRHGVDPAQLARAFQIPANANAFRESITTLARLRSRP
ncbi:DUF4350 domain-containing protein [Dyella sp.]|uniref:DUF4350 domain-containing protein n=1 Tax=Dyella sp. TaxID=1869338 RepID=UPI00321778C7